MSKSGGIAYLIKHGRAPISTVTRTPVKGKGYAAGGMPISNSLGYGPEYDYVFVPGSMELDASGKPVYRSGRFERKTTTPTTAVQDPYARDARGSETGGGDGTNTGGGGVGSNVNTSGIMSGPLGYALSSLAAHYGLLGSRTQDPTNVPVEDAMARAEQEAAANAAQTGLTNSVAVGDMGFGYGGGDMSGLSGISGTTGINTGDMGFGYGGGDVGSLGGGYDSGADALGAGGDGTGQGDVGGDTSDGVGYARGGLSSLGSYSDGGRLLRGPGDGLSDHIPAVIGKKQPARLADGEFVVSADVVSALGGGSTEAGSRKLYDMMDRIRKSAHGTKKQVKAVSDKKVLPA